MQRICVIILAVMLAGCSTRKTPTLYGVEVKGTPFDLMERLVYDAHDQCMPVEFLPMADGMYIFAILADGEEVVIYCETDKNNQITNIKVSNTMLDINSQITPPHQPAKNGKSAVSNSPKCCVSPPTFWSSRRRKQPSPNLSSRPTTIGASI